MKHSFDLIRNNILVDGSDIAADGTVAQCNCQPRRGEPTCVDTSCVNFATMTECVKCNANCANNYFTKRKYRQIEVRDTPPKGRGLFAMEDIPAHSFIYEYMGEIVNFDTIEQRMEQSFHEPHLYVLQIKPNNFIDARYKANISRYINHSCEPNCCVDMWNVGGRIRVGIFSTVDIPTGTELSFDYGWTMNERPPTKCYCGTPSCRGYIELLTEEQISKLNTRRGVWMPSTYLTSPSHSGVNLRDTPTFLIDKRVRIFFDGNQSFFDADVLSYHGEGCYLVRYLFDDEEKLEKLVDIPRDTDTSTPAVEPDSEFGDTKEPMKRPQNVEQWQYLDETKEEIKIKKKSSVPSDECTAESASEIVSPQSISSSTFPLPSPTTSATKAFPLASQRGHLGFGMRPQQIRERFTMEFDIARTISDFPPSRSAIIASLVSMYEKEYNIKVYESMEAGEKSEISLVLFGDKDNVSAAKGNLVLRRELIMYDFRNLMTLIVDIFREQRASHEEQEKQRILNKFLQTQPLSLTNDWRRRLEVKHYTVPSIEVNVPTTFLPSDMLPVIPAIPLHDKITSTILTMSKENTLPDRITVQALLITSRCLDKFPISTLGDLTSFAVCALFCALKSSGTYRSRYNSLCDTAYAFRVQELEKQMLSYLKYDIYVPNVALLLEPSVHTKNADVLLLLLLQHSYNYVTPPELYQLACIIVSILFNVTPDSLINGGLLPPFFIAVRRSLIDSRVVLLQVPELANLVNHILTTFAKMTLKKPLSELLTMNDEWRQPENTEWLLTHAARVVINWCRCSEQHVVTPTDQIIDGQPLRPTAPEKRKCYESDTNPSKRARNDPSSHNTSLTTSASKSTSGNGDTSSVILAPKNVLRACYYNQQSPKPGTLALRVHCLLKPNTLPVITNPTPIAKAKTRQLFATTLDSARLYDDNLSHVFPSALENVTYVTAFEFATPKTTKYELKKGVLGVSPAGLHELGCYQHVLYCADSSVNILTPIAVAETSDSDLYFLFHPLTTFLPLTLLSNVPPHIRMSHATDFIAAVSHCTSIGIQFKYFELDAVMVNSEGRLMLGGFCGATYASSAHKPKPTSVILPFIHMYAPEVILGGEVTRASTVYSAGVALTYILLGNFIMPPAASEAKQLEYIYKILGTPEKVKYVDYHKLPYASKYPSTVTHEGKAVQCKRSLEKKLLAAVRAPPAQADLIVSLLNSMIHLAPLQRCSMCEAAKIGKNFPVAPSSVLQQWVEHEHSKIMLNEGW